MTHLWPLVGTPGLRARGVPDRRLVCVVSPTRTLSSLEERIFVGNTSLPWLIRSPQSFSSIASWKKRSLLTLVCVEKGPKHPHGCPETKALSDAHPCLGSSPASRSRRPELSSTAAAVAESWRNGGNRANSPLASVQLRLGKPGSFCRPKLSLGHDALEL